MCSIGAAQAHAPVMLHCANEHADIIQQTVGCSEVGTAVFIEVDCDESNVFGAILLAEVHKDWCEESCRTGVTQGAECADRGIAEDEVSATVEIDF